MKNVIIISMMSIVSMGISSGQVLGGYSFHGSDQTPSGGLNTNPATAESLKPTYVSDDCVVLSSIRPSTGYSPNPRNWSTSTYDSSITSGPTTVSGNGLPGNHADCFAGWSSKYSSSHMVKFDLTFDANTAGLASDVSLKIGNYGFSADPRYFKLSVLKNGSEVYTSSVRSITSKWATQSFDLSAANLTSTVGSNDVFTFRIGAYGAKRFNSSGRIALDDIVIKGKADCKVPEPSSVALLGLGSLGLLLRRRK